MSVQFIVSSSLNRRRRNFDSWLFRIDGGRPEICQLVAYNMTDITVKGSWLGPGWLHLVPHVNDFPVRKIIRAHHFVADVTLPYGRVLFDYNKD